MLSAVAYRGVKIVWNMMKLLVLVLYWLSSALLIPVVALLLLFVMWCLLECGGLLREFQERRRHRGTWQAWSRQAIGTAAADPATFFDSTDYPGLLGLFALRSQQPGGTSTCVVEKHFADLEVTASSRLSRMSVGIRIGPTLGLMGTLIPLGPALMGLTKGNLNEMAQDLVVAFSTTVLGLLVGGACYGMWLVRRQWYAQDLADIDFVVRCLPQQEQPWGPVDAD